MGSSCCHAESPCSSVEERSGLLKDESKLMAPTGNPRVQGTCGPQGDNSLRIIADEPHTKAEVKAEAVQEKSPEVTDTSNSQDIGPLKEEVTDTGTPFTQKMSELKENYTRAQAEDVKDCPVDSGYAELLQRTLNWPKTEPTASPEEEEDPNSANDRIPDISSPTAEAVCLENHTKINATMEHIVLAVCDNGKDVGSILVEVVAEASGHMSENYEVLSLPDTRRSSSIAAVSWEIDREPLNCVATEDSENGSSFMCNESGPELIKNPDIFESSSGSEPMGLDHSSEEGDSVNSVNSVKEPEITELKDASGSPNSDQDAESNLLCTTTSLNTTLENIRQGTSEKMTLDRQEEDGWMRSKMEGSDETNEEVKDAPAEGGSHAGNLAEIQEVTVGDVQLAGRSSTYELSVLEMEAEESSRNSDEDLYRGEEELSPSQENETGLLLSLGKVEDRCSLAPAMDILSYSEREWKGHTAKSALIRKGYKEMSQTFCSLRRVRGDNYCALRATLFQALTHSSQLPSWLQEEDVTLLPEQLEAQEGLISQWTFPRECLQGDGTGDAILQLKGYMELLRNKWQAAVDCSSAAEQQQLCEQVFRGGEEELGLLEALKLLMLGRAAELHGRMQAGGDVPLFCLLLFARDSSDCPRSFLSNHLSHVGLSAGLEQVEMFLLGHTLQCTIQVYRLYKADTEEFVTYYPDDHKDDWPSVSLVTEDDRHYNVPIVEAAEHKELNSS